MTSSRALGDARLDRHRRVHQTGKDGVGAHAVARVGGGEVLGERHHRRLGRLVADQRVRVAGRHRGDVHDRALRLAQGRQRVLAREPGGLQVDVEAALERLLRELGRRGVPRARGWRRRYRAGCRGGRAAARRRRSSGARRPRRSCPPRTARPGRPRRGSCPPSPERSRGGDPPRSRARPPAPARWPSPVRCRSSRPWSARPLRPPPPCPRHVWPSRSSSPTIARAKLTPGCRPSGRGGKLPPQEAIRAGRGRWRARRSRMTAAATSAIG
jgi:hypothetical protein